MLDLSSRKVYGALAEQCVGGDAKADKVESAVAGHLAGLDSNGNLTDSGVSPTEDVTVEGNPVTFESPFEQDAKSVVVSVKPIQAGSGTPSPENIRPISGIDEVEIDVSDGESAPTTTTIPLPSTLYGGTVDVTDGRSVADRAIVDLGSLTWDKSSHIDSIFYATLSGYRYASDTVMVASSYNYLGTTPDGTIALVSKPNGTLMCYYNIYNVYEEIYIKDDRYTDASTFKTAVTGQKLVYELATPTTISFDPTDVELLEGTNVVSTNAEKVAVTYKAGILATLGDIDDLNDKVKTKFDKKDVAKVEGANASKPYAVGDYMLRSDGFYVVTQAIAQNAPITSNNTDKTTVGNELSSKVDTDDSRLSDARTPVAHTHNISDITGIPAWTKLGEVTGTSPDYENSSTFNLSALQNKDVLMIFSVDEGTLTAKQGIITLEYSAFEFGKILEDSVQEEDEITRLWKGFYGGAPRQSVATFEEFLRGLGYVYIATHSTTAEIGAKIYGAYDWTLEIYTK